MKSMVLRAAALFVLTGLLAGTTGCGAGQAAVSGTVTYDGKPIEDGTITFVSAEKESIKYSGQILGGKYSIPQEKGPKAGKYKVEFTSFKKSGQKVSDGDGGTREDRTQVLPEKFHKGSTITEDIASGNQTKDYTLSP